MVYTQSEAKRFFVEKVLQQARAVLRQGDHYIQIMLDDAVGSKLKKWWEFW